MVTSQDAQIDALTTGDKYYREKNYAEAVKWYRKAAEQGNVGGQYNLGVMYSEGRGVERNDAEALKWYRKAAAQGNQSAQNELKNRGFTW